MSINLRNMKHISSESSLRDVSNGSIFMHLASLDSKLFVKTVFSYFELFLYLLILDAWKCYHLMRLIMAILMICVSNLYDHWMVSYRELIFFCDTIFLPIFLILHFKDFNRTPCLLTLEI